MSVVTEGLLVGTPLGCGFQVVPVLTENIGNVT
jgi:hypothetical protein